MIREFKATIKPTTANSCNVFYEARDNYGTWKEQGYAPRRGTVEEIRNDLIAGQTQWGWTLYDVEDGDTLTFWKEF